MAREIDDEEKSFWDSCAAAVEYLVTAHGVYRELAWQVVTRVQAGGGIWVDGPTDRGDDEPWRKR